MEPALIAAIILILESPHWYASPEWLLVIVGIATCVVIGWQSIATSQAARAAEDSAKAARDAIEANTQQFAAENRPWVFIEKEPTREKIDEPYIAPPSQAPVGGQRMSYVAFYFKNYGKTCAKIVESKQAMWIGMNCDAPPTLESFDRTEATSLIQIFPPGETLAREAYLRPQEFITNEEAQAVNLRRRFLWLCGFVRYQSTFGGRDAPIYETTFCYFWETRTNSPRPYWWPGPNEYNKTT